MLQQIVQAFFIGQVVCEHACQAAQDAFASTKCKADDKVEQFSLQVKEATADKGARLFEQVQEQCKHSFVNLRQKSASFEKVCESLERLLIETGEKATVSSALD